MSENSGFDIELMKKIITRFGFVEVKLSEDSASNFHMLNAMLEYKCEVTCVNGHYRFNKCNKKG